MGPKSVIAGLAAVVVFYVAPLPGATPDVFADMQGGMRDGVEAFGSSFKNDEPKRLGDGRQMTDNMSKCAPGSSANSGTGGGVSNPYQSCR